MNGVRAVNVWLSRINLLLSRLIKSALGAFIRVFSRISRCCSAHTPIVSGMFVCTSTIEQLKWPDSRERTHSSGHRTRPARSVHRLATSNRIHHICFGCDGISREICRLMTVSISAALSTRFLSVQTTQFASRKRHAKHQQQPMNACRKFT